MHLSQEQADRFYDLMDSLLLYVNDRFRVVEGFAEDANDKFADAKAQLVAQTLWDQPDVIDDFVAENREGWHERDLDQVRQWKYALVDSYLLVRYQDGMAILMSDAGLFAVAGLDDDPEEAIGPAPASVDLVLVPFEGGIVYDGFINVYDLSSVDEARQMYDRYEELVAQGIAFTDVDFIARAKGVLAERHEKALDDLLADVEREAAGDVPEQLPSGYHRGALAGLSPEERARAKQAHDAKQNSGFMYFHCKDEEPHENLNACLELFSKESLLSLARMLGMRRYSHLKKSQLAARLADELTTDDLLICATLTSVDDTALSAFVKLYREGDTAVAPEEVADSGLVPALPPLTYAFEQDGAVRFVMPPEVRALVDDELIDAVRETRAADDAIYNCANACAIYLGIAPMEHVYAEYRRVAPDPVAREEFDRIVGQIAQAKTGLFDCITYGETDYLVHFTLSGDYVAQQVMRVRTGDVGSPQISVNKETHEVKVSGLRSESSPLRMTGDLKAELENVDAVRTSLLEDHASMEPRPIPDDSATTDQYAKILDDKRVRALRAYLDERVPDGADDYAYADWVAEGLVQSAIEIGDMEDMLDICDDVGATAASSGSQRLYTLVSNVYSVMPSWENNGWSAVELLEKMTGRTVFFNDDGQVIRVGADDPCPCGSGLKYKDCHGR